MLRPQRPPRSGGDLDIYRTLDVCHSMSLVTIAIMFISVVVSWRLLLHTGTPYREEAHTICSTHTLAGFLDRCLHIPGASPTAPFLDNRTSLSSLVLLSMNPLAILVGNEERVVKVPRPEC
jgi:hypothetical protein